MLHHLREHELAQVHPYLPRAVRPQDGPVPRRRRGSNRQLDEGSLSKRFSTTYHDRSAQRWDTIDGTYTLNTLVNFSGGNGSFPVAGLIADGNGDLFGTTHQGGSNDDGTVFELVNNNGTYT